MSQKIINESSDIVKDLKKELAALKRRYAAERRNLLEQIDQFKILRSEKEMLEDIPIIFRWFPAMVLSLSSLIKRHRVAASLVFMVLFVCLEAMMFDWMRDVAQERISTISLSCYLSVCISFFVVLFFGLPWIKYVFDGNWQSRKWYLTGMVLFLMVFYSASMVFWASMMLGISEETAWYLRIAIVWFLLCLYGTWRLNKKFGYYSL